MPLDDDAWPPRHPRPENLPGRHPTPTQGPLDAAAPPATFFGGLSLEETAEAVSVSVATVRRDWTLARAWLNRELKD